MGDMQDLRNHYNKKWQELLDVTESKLNGILEYSVWMCHSDWGYVKLLIEYDQNKPCYGIYFGCKIGVKIIRIRNDKSEELKVLEDQKAQEELKELKKHIWKSYKEKIYPNAPVEMDNVFLPDCERDCQEKEKMLWFFWIRLDEHLVMEDAMQRLYLLVKIFKEQGFTR